MTEIVHPTFGDYLAEDDPLSALWLHLIKTIYRDSPRIAKPEYLSHSAQVILHTGVFSGEVYNGGISQFFTNSSGDWTAETLDALKEIEANSAASHLLFSMKALGLSLPIEDRTQRWEAVQQAEAQEPGLIDRLDKRVYAILDDDPSDDLYKLQLVYMTKHADRLVLASSSR